MEIFKSGDSLILKYQYFNKIKLMDIHTKKQGIYTKKGAR